MNIKFFCFVFFNSFLVFSQKNSLCGSLEYSYTINGNIGAYKEDYKMVFNDSISFSLEMNVNKSNFKEEKKNNELQEQRNFIEGRNNTTPRFYYKTPKDFYFSTIIEDKTIVVKENANEWNWDLHDEFKKIGSFDCQKATIKFRGRNYIAWFTKEIPVSHGLWKFQGLFGLILEVYEENYFLHLTTTNIAINENCSIAIEKKLLENSLSVKEYLEVEKESAKAFFERISSKLPKGSKPLVLDENCKDCNSGKLEIFNK